jgi:hypothetical protein
MQYINETIYLKKLQFILNLVNKSIAMLKNFKLCLEYTIDSIKNAQSYIKQLKEIESIEELLIDFKFENFTKLKTSIDNICELSKEVIPIRKKCEEIIELHSYHITQEELQIISNAAFSIAMKVRNRAPQQKIENIIDRIKIYYNNMQNKYISNREPICGVIMDYCLNCDTNDIYIKLLKFDYNMIEEPTFDIIIKYNSVICFNLIKIPSRLKKNIFGTIIMEMLAYIYKLWSTHWYYEIDKHKWTWRYDDEYACPYGFYNKKTKKLIEEIATIYEINRYQFRGRNIIRFIINNKEYKETDLLLLENEIDTIINIEIIII